MPLSFSEPFWWYGRRGFGVPELLSPIAAIYGTVSGRRLQKPPVFDPKIPVICVGNFVAGGSGKSPVVRSLIGLLKKRGHRPVILSRGYGGRLRGPIWVGVGHHSHHDVGDEPLMLASDAPVMVSADRAKGARAIVSKAEFDVIVMDDGLQNPALAKTLSLAVVNGTRGIGNGWVIPSGPLRAPLSLQSKFVHAIIRTGSRETRIAEVGAFHANTGAADELPVLDATVVGKLAPDLKIGSPVFVFAAIANPERVATTAAAAGLRVAGHRWFPDHHNFSDAEIALIGSEATSLGAQPITTAKDIVRLKTGTTSARALAEQTKTIEIELRFNDEDQAALNMLLSKAMAPDD